MPPAEKAPPRGQIPKVPAPFLTDLVEAPPQDSREELFAKRLARVRELYAEWIKAGIAAETPIEVFVDLLDHPKQPLGRNPIGSGKNGLRIRKTFLDLASQLLATKTPQATRAKVAVALQSLMLTEADPDAWTVACRRTRDRLKHTPRRKRSASTGDAARLRIGEYADQYHRALFHLCALFAPQVKAAKAELRETLLRYPHPLFMPTAARANDTDLSLLGPIVNLYQSLSRRLIGAQAHRGGDLQKITKTLARSFREAPLIQWIEAQHELTHLLCSVQGAVSILHSEGLTASAEPLGTALKRRAGLTNEAREALWKDWVNRGKRSPSAFAWRVLGVVDVSVLRDWEQKCREAKLPELCHPHVTLPRELDRISAKLDWLQHLLIHLNMPLARSRVRAWLSMGKKTLLNEEELRSFASEGLMKSLNKYYPASGSLSTLIYLWIRDRLRRASAQHGHLIGRTLEAEDLRDAIQIARISSPGITPAELAAKLKKPEAKIMDALAIPTVAREADFPGSADDDDSPTSVFDRAVESAQFDRPDSGDARVMFDNKELREEFLSIVQRDFTAEDILQLAHLGLYDFREAREILCARVTEEAAKRVMEALGPDPKRRHLLKNVKISRAYQGTPPPQTPPDGGAQPTGT